MLKRLMLVMLALVVTAQAPGAAPPKLDELDEVVVEGRVPGPPLWKITNGNRVFWILPIVDIYPRNIEWDSGRVERLLAGSEEYIYKPRNGSTFPGISAGGHTILRTMLAGNKLTHLPRGTTLADVLPADLYRRLQALQARYFPDTKINHLTIWQARWVMEEEILDKQRLALIDYSELNSPKPITEKLYRWLNRSNLDRRTYTSYFETSDITSKQFKEVSRAVEKWSLSAEAMRQDIACMEKAVNFFELEFGAAKRRANAWAQGRADGLVNPARLYTESDSCREPPLQDIFKGNAELERFLSDNPAFAPDYVAMDEKRRVLWLAEAERALQNNTKTFGVLTVDDILGKGSLVAVLEARGYKVEVIAAQ